MQLDAFMRDMRYTTTLLLILILGHTAAQAQVAFAPRQDVDTEGIGVLTLQNVVNVDTSQGEIVVEGTVAALDTDNDGDLDLVVANPGTAGSDNISVLQNNGDGTFTLDAVQLDASGNPVFVLAVDVNVDNRSDLVTLNARDVGGGNTLAINIFLNGDNGLEETPSITNTMIEPCTTSNNVLCLPVVATAADFQGDGTPNDLAISSLVGHSTRVFLQTGDEAIGEVNYVSQQIDGRDFFLHSQCCRFPNSVRAGDVDGNGIIDLIIGTVGRRSGFTDRVEILPGQQNGFNVNSALEVDFVFTDRRCQVPDPTDPNQGVPDEDCHTISVTAADFNGDSQLDVAVANEFGGAFRDIPLSGPGSNDLAEATALTYQAAPGAFLRADLLRAGSTQGLPRLFRLTPTGEATLIGSLDHISKGLAFSLDGSMLYSIARNDDQLRVVDPINASTTSTIAITESNNGTVTGGTGLATHPNTGVLWGVLKIQNTFVRHLATINPTTGEATIIGITEEDFAGLAFDANGTLYGIAGDGSNTPETLFTLDTNDATATVFNPLGRGGSGEAIAFNAADNRLYHASGLGDFSGDLIIFESIDLANFFATGLLTLLQNNNGDGTFTRADLATIPNRGLVFVTQADLDNINGPDLVVVNQDANSLSVLLNNGDGTFMDEQLFSVGTSPRAVVAVDLDDDGDNDLAVINSGSNTVSVLLNQLQRLSTPTTDNIVAGNAVAVALQDDPGVEVASVQFRFRAVETTAFTDIGTAVTMSPLVAAWDTTALTDGAYELQALVATTTGAFLTSTPVRVMVDNSAAGTPDIVENDGIKTQRVAAAEAQIIITADGAHLDIPAGALTATGTLSIQRIDDTTGLPTLPGDVAGLLVEITQSNAQEMFTPLLLLTLPYRDTDQNGMVDDLGADEEALTLRFFDDAAARWVEVTGATVDLNANTIRGTVGHLTPFGVFAEPTVEVVSLPSPQDFGMVAVGTAATQEFMVANMGQGSLNVGTLTLTNMAIFSLPAGSDTCSNTTVAPGAACMATVRFAPLEAGEQQAILTIPSNDPETPQVLVELRGTGTAPNIMVAAGRQDFGTVVVGETGRQSIEIQNQGDANLMVTSTTVPNGTAFMVESQTCMAPIPPGMACMVMVSFAPQMAGAQQATLTIASNDPDAPQVTVTLSGMGAAPAIAVDPLDFGTVTIGTTNTQNIAVRNQGTAPLSVTGVTLDVSEVFVLDGETCIAATEIPPAGVCMVTVSFAPQVAGAQQVTLTIASNDPDLPQVAVTLSGTGNPAPVPNLAVDLSPSFTFQDVALGTTGTQVFTVENQGNANLTITNVTVPTATAFRLTANNTCNNTTLIPMATCTFEVIFTPTAMGLQEAELAITSNDPDSPLPIALRGTGICPPDGDVDSIDGPTSEDAVLAFQHFLGLGLVSLDACQILRANVVAPDTSGVTPADAQCILQAALNIASCL